MADKLSGPQDIGLREPRGALSIRTLCMPSDTNPYGDIFGGWLLGQMDIAGGVFAAVANGRTVTVAVDGMAFRKSVHVGDVICLYTDLIRIGNTSVTVQVEVFAERNPANLQVVRVTEAKLTYVAIDGQGKPRSIPKD